MQAAFWIGLIGLSMNLNKEEKSQSLPHTSLLQLKNAINLGVLGTRLWSTDINTLSDSQSTGIFMLNGTT